MTKPSVNLPVISDSILPWVGNITTALNVPRGVLACDEDIQYAWNDLPRELNKIPPELRDELLARMCVAIATGLFDGAINYIWNCSIRNLRKKVRDFGFSVVAQILNDTSFDEDKLVDLKDADLLSLCLKLNLISEEGYFFLDQCRDIRNNFSAAHPNIALIDDRELISFISRCGKYALSTTVNLRGVEINTFIFAIKGGRFNQSQLDTWIERLNCTHDAQREMLFGTLHGIYCDPSSNEESRINSLLVCQSFSTVFTPTTKSNLLNRHYDYQAKGDTVRHSASQVFFDKLGLLSLLNEAERHSIISNACKRLISVHLGMDNFYNEPSFAQRLDELSQGTDIPETAKEEYVISVLTCFVGNPYGVSRAAIKYYENMIKNFSPREIQIMLNVQNISSNLRERIKVYQNCKNRYISAVNLINEQSVPAQMKHIYDKIIKEKSR